MTKKTLAICYAFNLTHERDQISALQERFEASNHSRQRAEP